MAQDLEAIVVGQTGKIYYAPIGSTAPTDVSSAWDTAWVDLGTISEDGMTMSFNEDTSDIKQWGGGVVRKLITGSETTFQFKCLETSRQVVETFYKTALTAPVAPATEPYLEIKGGVRDEKMWGIDVVDGDTHNRFVIPRGEISARGDVVWKADQAAEYEFTVTAYQDENLVAAIQYSDIANWVPAGP